MMTWGRYIPLPDDEARRGLVLRLLERSEGTAHTLDDAALDSIVRKSRGYSGADMAHLCTEAGALRGHTPDGGSVVCSDVRYSTAQGPIRSYSFEQITTMDKDAVRPYFSAGVITRHLPRLQAFPSTHI
eukprot:COSAG01_NODE_20693_length_939_cov_103.569048_1_plen_129_part_00